MNPLYIILGALFLVIASIAFIQWRLGATEDWQTGIEEHFNLDDDE